MSYLTELRCTTCSQTYDPKFVQTFCTACQSPLLVYYDLETARGELDREEVSKREAGMWRWRELLPVHDPAYMLTLGEGDTPLLHVPKLGREMGFSQLYIKDESLNPTGSFKARGLAAAVSKAKELGIRKVIIPTAGNAGGAMAAYAARGGLDACIFMPADTPLANIEESRITGADVIMVNGLISDAAAEAEKKARSEGWFSVSTFKEPYRTEGKKVMGYELAEQLSWKLPEVIVYPTGGGTGLVGMWKAFAELDALGWLEGSNRPRLVAVQSAGCAPVVEAFEAGATRCDFWQDAQTIASGLRVPKSFADTKMLQDIRESNGTAVAVSDDEILAAQSHLGRAEGIFAAPEGAATLAGLYKLIERGWVRPEERIVLFNTGSGLKYVHT